MTYVDQTECLLYMAHDTLLHTLLVLTIKNTGTLGTLLRLELGVYTSLDSCHKRVVH